MATRPRWLRWYLGLYEDTVMPRSSAILFPLAVLAWVVGIAVWIWESPTTSRFIVGALAIPAGVGMGVWSQFVGLRAVRATRESGRAFKDLPGGQRALIITLLVVLFLVAGYLGIQSEWTSE